MATIKKRAVNAKQKEQRRQDILDSARTLFVNTEDYDALLMKHIAENIQLTKGTLYLYFKTKEEVFLALYTQEFNSRFNAINELIKKNEDRSIDTFLNIVSESIISQNTFLRLNSLLHTVLEQNINAETALEFKTLLRDRIIDTGEMVESLLPFLKLGQGAELLLTMHSLMIGCFHVATPTPCLTEIFQRPDMAFMKLDFETEFTKALRLILLGFESLNSH